MVRASWLALAVAFTLLHGGWSVDGLLASYLCVHVLQQYAAFPFRLCCCDQPLVVDEHSPPWLLAWKSLAAGAAGTSFLRALAQAGPLGFQAATVAGNMRVRPYHEVFPAA